MLKWYKVAVALLLVLALLVAFGCAPPPVEEVEVEEEEEVEAVGVKTVLIGLLGSLTGPLRSIAGSIYGNEDYLTYVNEQGGIEYLDPKTGKTEHLKFEWITGDHAWDSAKCISLYERFKGAGVIWMFSNGSVPSVSIYALMARDHIPGTPVGCTFEPCLYEIDEPYLHANMGLCGTIPPVTSAYFVQYLWDKPGKPKIGHLAADVGSRRIYDEPKTYAAVEQAGAELLPIEYIPIAPVDIKIQLGRLVEEGANLIIQDHWGDAANRVFMHNVIDLKLWEKDVMIWWQWMDPKVSLAEPDVWATYEEMGGKMLGSVVGWGGSQPEYDKWAADPQFSGVKLAFDLCKKYRGCLPEGVGGGYYSEGIRDGMVMEMVFKETLEKHGYEGLTGKALRDTLFAIEVVDVAGITPSFFMEPLPALRCDDPWTQTVVIKDGHHIFDPEVHGFVETGAMWGYTFNRLNSDPEWQEKWGKYVFTDYMEAMP